MGINSIPEGNPLFQVNPNFNLFIKKGVDFREHSIGFQMHNA